MQPLPAEVATSLDAVLAELRACVAGDGGRDAARCSAALVALNAQPTTQTVAQLVACPARSMDRSKGPAAALAGGAADAMAALMAAHDSQNRRADAGRLLGVVLSS